MYFLRKLALIFCTYACLLILNSCSNNETSQDYLSESEINESIKKGIIYTRNLEYENSYNTLSKALDDAKLSGLKKQEVLATINLGLLYRTFNENEEALVYSLRSLDLALEYKTEELYNTVYNNIGIIHSENKDFDEAYRYFKMALRISKQQKEAHRIAINLINIAEIKDEINQNDSAIYYNNAVLQMTGIDSFPQIQSLVFNNIGEILFEQNKIEEAKAKFDTSYAFVLKYPYNPPSDIALIQFNTGKALVKMQEYKLAEAYLKRALDLYLQTKNSTLISDCYYWLYVSDSSQKQDSLSQNYIDQCLAWKDSSMFEIKNKWTSNVQMKYEFGKKQKEIEFLEEKAQTQKIIIFIIILLALVLILFIVSIWKSRNQTLKQRNVILNKEREVGQLEKEKNKLKRLKLEEEILNQKKLAEIRDDQTKRELEHKNREVTSRAVHLMNKNEILGSIFELIEKSDDGSHDASDTLKEVKSIIKNNLSQDKTWEDLKLHFEKVHESFISNLNEKHPELSPTDLRLCAYLLIDLSPKEIANISNISPESVRKRKQRLREKMDLDSSTSLEDYLKSL